VEAFACAVPAQSLPAVQTQPLLNRRRCELALPRLAWLRRRSRRTRPPWNGSGDRLWYERFRVREQCQPRWSSLHRNVAPDRVQRQESSLKAAFLQPRLCRSSSLLPYTQFLIIANKIHFVNL